MIATTDILKSPFPWFGGKSRAAHIIWPRLGEVPNYVEPFAGSLAVLMRRPHAPGNEIVNDLDCYVANAWRAMQQAPELVASYCDWPVNEADLHARHRWLHARGGFRLRMEHEPDFYDARIAGYWIWGLSCWIGDNFCRPKPQAAAPLLTGECGVQQNIGRIQIPRTTGGQGVARQVPHLTGGKGGGPSGGPGGRQAPYARESCRAATQTQNLQDWFAALADRLRFTKICCGDWARVLTKASTYGQGLSGILLDPPYDTDGHDDVYGELSRGVSGFVSEWAIANGTNPLLRIALCGYEGEHAMPADWTVVEWKAGGGFGNQSGNQNGSRERIWFSPHCLNPEAEPELFT
jgi:DNA adenine methylase